MKSKTEIKNELANLVSIKRAATRVRVEYKSNNPPSDKRGSQLRSFWRECKEAKENIRYVQLAYALVRGKSYWTQERKTRPDNIPSAYALGIVAGCTTDEAKAWISAEVTPEEYSAFVEHEKASKEKARAAKAAVTRSRKVA